ncbi:unnamed protein product [Leptidea sinapis]|uniref:EF-hand domain-containing protein n=1 Tax=Leptidea sinapis TaxID=189913 RepID=A0A5E4QN76_9NEOP|nr:unnamed protein product [Leptidea sinapis]
MENGSRQKSGHKPTLTYFSNSQLKTQYFSFFPPRYRWAFRLYDVDGDGAITRQELAEVVVAVHELLGRRAPPGSPASRVDDAKANEQIIYILRGPEKKNKHVQ